MTNDKKYRVELSYSNTKKSPEFINDFYLFREAAVLTSCPSWSLCISPTRLTATPNVTEPDFKQADIY